MKKGRKYYSLKNGKQLKNQAKKVEKNYIGMLFKASCECVPKIIAGWLKVLKLWLYICHLLQINILPFSAIIDFRKNIDLIYAKLSK